MGKPLKIDPEFFEGIKPLDELLGKKSIPANNYPISKLIPMAVNTPYPTQETAEPFSTLELCDPYRITTEKDIPNPPPTITINGAAVAAPGNITGISAQSKAGKTAISGAIISGSINDSGTINGFHDLNVLPNDEKKAVIRMDTEQAAGDQQNLVRVELNRAGLNATPDFYYSYNIRQLKFEEYETFTNNACALAAEKHRGIHLIVIDGGADFIASVNDEEASYRIIQYFIHLSIKYSCPVVIIVHLNPFSEKERGHFGSELQRKCYGLLTISKDGDVSTLQAKIMRRAGNGDIPQISFAFDKQLGYHIQVDTPDKENLKAERNMERMKDLVKIVFVPPAAYTHAESVSRIMKHTKKGESTAKRYLRDMIGFQFVIKGVDKNHRINTENDEERK